MGSSYYHHAVGMVLVIHFNQTLVAVASAASVAG